MCARYAFTGLTALRGPNHPGTARAGYALGTLLRRQGDPGAAADVYREVVAAMLKTGMRDQADLVCAQQYAAAHAAGHCRTSTDALEHVWSRWRRIAPSLQQRGLPIVVRLTAMSAACGLHDRTLTFWSEAAPIIEAGPAAAGRQARLMTHVLTSETLREHRRTCQVKSRFAATDLVSVGHLQPFVAAPSGTSVGWRRL